MLPSWRLARNNLAGRRSRTVLMAGAVALAASLIVAVSCTIASAQAALEHNITRFLGATDARIIHPGNSRFDASLLETVRGWDDVDAATGRLRASLTLVRKDGGTDAETGEPLRASPSAIGIDFDLEPRFRVLELASGGMPDQRNEILIDPLLQEEMQIQLGDVLVVQRFGEPIELIVAGIYQRQKLGTLQRPRLFINAELLGEATGRAGQLTSIQIMLEEDTDVEAFCQRNQSELAEPLELEPAVMVRAGFDKRIRASQIALMIATVLAFMAASFIIVTGMTTGVTERQREMALLRCIGAARVQVFLSQLLVGLVFGVLGAVIGVPLGIGLASVMVWIFRDYVPTGLSVHWLGVSLTIAGSVCAGLLGAMYPAYFASRVPPLQAMTQQARPIRPRSIVLCSAVALVCIATQLLLLLPEGDETRFWLFATTGLPIAFIGYFLLGVPLLVLVTMLTTPLLSAALRLPRDMLRGAIMSTPFRHGLTAGALMVGMAILVDGWAAGQSVIDDWIAEIRFADGFAYRLTGIPPEHQQAIADLPFVEATCPISYLPVRIADRQVFGLSGLSPRDVVCVGFDPEVFFRINEVDWIEGDPDEAIAQLAAGEGAIVAERFLTAKNIGVGDSLTLSLGRTERPFRIVGVVSAGGLDIATQLFGIRSQYMEFAVSCVFVDFETVAEVFGNDDAYMLQVNLSDEISDAEAEQRIEAAAPGAMFRSGRWIMDTALSIARGLLTVQSTMAFAALVLASIAVGHVIAANINGRRFEYGVMRAIGTQRGTIVRLILGEAIVLAISAALLGTIFGYHLAWMDARHLRDLAGLPVGVSAALEPISIGWLVLIGLTLIAALPSTFGLIRRQPGELLAIGRNE